MDCTRFGKAVILRQKTEDMKLGLFAIGTAWLNYRKAKAEYEALEEKQQALQAAVDTYNMEKYEDYDERQDAKAYKEETHNPGGLEVSTVLRVGNLVGKYMRVRGSVVMSNTSDKPIRIIAVEARWFIFSNYVYIIESLTSAEESTQHVMVNKTIQPGETLEVELQKGISSLVNEKGEILLGQLRDAICTAAGKKLITSCPKINVEGLETANFRVWWGNGINEYVSPSYYVNGQPGVLRYMGEAYYG